MKVNRTYSARRDVVELRSGNGGQGDNGGDGECLHVDWCVLVRIDVAKVQCNVYNDCEFVVWGG